MSISPFEFSQFKRQQGMMNPIWPQPHPLTSPMMQRPWGMMQHMPSGNQIEHEETVDSHMFRVRVQGKDDVRVYVDEGRMLRISARGADHREEGYEGGGFYRVERSSGEFLSNLKLPEDADADRATTNVEGGTLTVVMPRRRLNALASY